MLTTSYQIARIWGIPIRVHFSLVLFLPIIALQFSPILGEGWLAWLWGLSAALGLFASVALHELGHSLVALRLGFWVREILLLPIGGAAQLARMPRQPRQELVIALAGPAVSLLLGIIFWALVRGSGPSLAASNINRVFVILMQLNIALAIFNLLPSFPMDGGRVLRALLTPFLGRLRATRLAVILGRGLAILLGLVGAFPPFNLLLVAIAFFLYSMAGAEYRMVLGEETKPSRDDQWLAS